MGVTLCSLRIVTERRQPDNLCLRLFLFVVTCCKYNKRFLFEATVWTHLQFG
jgi:hypothetical protein